MKKAMVIFEQVRDCPQWADGECLEKDTNNGLCYADGLRLPPDDCPMEDADA